MIKSEWCSESSHARVIRALKKKVCKIVGGVGSPLLANLRLDGRAKAWERRGHRCVRDAADGHIDVNSARAGPRVWASGTRVLARRWKRVVKATKRAVDRPWRRTFWGLTCTGHRPNRRRGSAKALKACKQEVRWLTSRTRGVALGRGVGDRRRYREGWYADVSCAEAPSVFTELDAWRRRRLRGSRWQQWGRRRYRARRRRGVSWDLAWNTVKSAQGPWRLSRSPARAGALLGSSFDGLGLPRLHRGSHRGRHPPDRRRRAPSVRWGERGAVARPPPIPIRSLRQFDMHPKKRGHREIAGSSLLC
jgi:RNA-directed DNA polymerase